MDGIAREHERAGLRQLHQQGLMARCMPGCREDRYAAVAEDVVVAFDLGDRLLGFEATGAKRGRPLVFGLLAADFADGLRRIRIRKIGWNADVAASAVFIMDREESVGIPTPLVRER